MEFLRAAYRRVKALFLGKALDSDMDREMRAHLDLLVEEYERTGMSPEEARRAASRRFGNLLRIKERGRDIRGAGILEDLLRDARNAMRNLRRTPGFTVTVVLTLAIGIGANTALFSVIDRLLLRPLPYPQGEQLMMVYETLPLLKLEHADVSPANWLDWQRESRSFEALAAWSANAMTLTGEGEPQRLNGQAVSAEFFDLLRVPPSLGRTFTMDDDQPDTHRVVVLSGGFWRRRFGGAPNVIGKTIELDANAYEIVGVMPSGFRLVSPDADYWVPYGLSRTRNWRQTSGRFINVVGRLKPSITQSVAQAEMAGIARQLSAAYTFNRDTSVSVVGLREALTGEVKASLLTLFAAVGILVLIACFNVASMLLARSAARRQDFAIRASLGAGRGAIVRQLLVESMVLAFAGGLSGVVVARAGVSALLKFIPQNLMGITEVPLDGSILLYITGLSVLTGSIFGLAPAMSTTRRVFTAHLRGMGRSFTTSSKLRQHLVTAQIAMTVVLLCGAGLLTRSLMQLVGTKTGMDAHGVLTMYMQPPERRYDDVQRVQLFKNVIERLRVLPGVQLVAAASSIPVIGPDPVTVAHIHGMPPLFQGQDLNAGLRVQDINSIPISAAGGLLPHARVVAPGYFKTLGIPVLQGREFVESDQRENAQPVFIVNEALASKYLAGQDPLSASLSVLMSDRNPYGRIVGVVGNVIEGSLRKAAEPTVFYADGNNSAGGFAPGMTIFIRSSGVDVAKAAVQAIREVDKNQPVTQLRMLEDVLGESVFRERLAAVVSSAFALTALLLAGLGLYGLLAYSVAERTKEIGIRMALGAKPAAVLRMIMTQGFRLIVAGLLLGLAGATAVSRLIESLLFGVSIHDPLTFFIVPALLLTVGGISAFIPAHRATRVDPMIALRQD
ncbi:MAG TPA: ABC transporter permease [Terriglobia bacterium]|nr:ABC transporter permease [Terriglobia bacterium]